MTCKHCQRPIAENGTHAEGLNRGKHRCDPKDSGLPYGYNAETVNQPCSAACLGSRERVPMKLGRKPRATAPAYRCCEHCKSRDKESGECPYAPHVGEPCTITNCTGGVLR